MAQEKEDIYLGSPDNPRTAAWVCYVTFIGWLIAYFGLYRSRKTAFAAFHIRQSLLIHIISLAIKVAYSFTFSTASFVIISILAAGLFALWVIALLNSLNDIQKPIPVIGGVAQRVFGGL